MQFFIFFLFFVFFFFLFGLMHNSFNHVPIHSEGGWTFLSIFPTWIDCQEKPNDKTESVMPCSTKEYFNQENTFNSWRHIWSQEIFVTLSPIQSLSTGISLANLQTIPITIRIWQNWKQKIVSLKVIIVLLWNTMISFLHQNNMISHVFLIIGDILASIRVKSIVRQILTFVRRLKPYETKQWKRTSDGSWKWCTLQIFQLRKFLNTPGGQSPLYTKLMRMCPLSHFTIDQVLSHDVRKVVSVIPLICLFTQTFSSIPAPVPPAIQTLW